MGRDKEPLAMYRTAMVQATGGVFPRIGWNEEVQSDRLFSAATFWLGLWAMFMAAVIVSVGKTPADGVREKSLPQSEPSPAIPPGEFTQLSIISASLLISLIGSIAPTGKAGPETVPAPMLTSLFRFWCKLRTQLR